MPINLPTGVDGITFEYAAQAQSQLNEKLKVQNIFEKELGKVVRQKTGEHVAHEVDDYSEALLAEVLGKYPNLGIKVFSEEQGWKTLGQNIEFKIICDPFCNTSLAVRSFRESATAICMVDKNNEFVSCAIADLNTERIFYADKNGVRTYFRESTGWALSPAMVSPVQHLADAFVVLSSLKKKRRVALQGKEIYGAAGQLHCLDGAIFIGRMATGYIDAYLDPYVGQPLYEVPCLEMVKRAGGVVTDIMKRDFNLAELVANLEHTPEARYKFIAAGSTALYNEIVAAL